MDSLTVLETDGRTLAQRDSPHLYASHHLAGLSAVFSKICLSTQETTLTVLLDMQALCDVFLMADNPERAKEFA